jgi:hypothetical protein
MRAARALDDDTIEAIIAAAASSSSPSPSAAPLVHFARQVGAVGAEPVPSPSSELAALLEGRTKPLLGTADAAPTLVATAGAVRRSRRHWRRSPSVAAKVALGTALAAAGVVSAGVTGILPAGANEAVRGAISAVSPVHLPVIDDDLPVDDSPDNSGPPAREGDRDPADDRDGDDRWRDHDDDHDRPDRDGGPDFADDEPGGRHRPPGDDVDENLDRSGVLGSDQDGSSGGDAPAPDAPYPSGDEADPGGDGRPGSQPPGGEDSSPPGGPTAP